MKRIFNYIKLIFSATVAVSLLAGCSSCEEPKVPDGLREGITLQFQILTRAPGSRAADIDGELEGAGYENFIDVSDVKYYIFDSNKKFIVDVTADAVTVAANEYFTLYDVVAKVDAPYFIDNIDGTLDFYILALANFSGWGVSVPVLNEGDDISSLFSSMPASVIPETEKLKNAVTDSDDRQLFPMTGLQRFTLSGSLLLTASQTMPFDISLVTGHRLNLLRSLAKIEVIDHINIGDDGFDDEDATSPLRLSNVVLNGYMTSGLLMPAMDQWNRNNTFETQQVIAPTCSPSDYFRRPPVLSENNQIGTGGSPQGYSVTLINDEYARQQREDKCPVYSCYVFEWSKTLLNQAGIPDTQYPYFTLTNVGGDYLGWTSESMTFPLRLTGPAAESVLRNQIYRFEISAIAQTIEMKWTICEMDKAATNIEFN